MLIIDLPYKLYLFELKIGFKVLRKSKNDWYLPYQIFRKFPFRKFGYGTEFLKK